MIAKITTGKSFVGLLQYNEAKVEKGEAKLLSQSNMPNYRGYEAAEYLRRNGQMSKVKEQVFHVSLSFSKADKQVLTNQKMIQIGDEYMDKMGMSANPYLIYRHHDTEHPHIHIVGSKINPINGKKIIEKNNRYKSKRITSELEKTYGLTRTKELGKGITEAKFEKINQEVAQALKYAPTTFAQLNNRLKKNDSDFRVKASRSGLIYYRVDKKGNQNSASWKGALFKSQGLDRSGLKSQFEASKKDATHLRKIIEQTLKERGASNKMPLAQYEGALLKKGIETKFSIGQKGKVYGLSYIYKEKEFKSSSISRDLSWNKLKDIIEAPANLKLREALKIQVEENIPIHINVNTTSSNTFTFNAGQQYIEERLNNMPAEKALQLAQHHNQHLKSHSANKIYPSFGRSNISTSKIVAHLSMARTDLILEEKEDSILKKKKYNRL